MENFYRDSWVEINLAHITYNIQQLQQRLPRHTNIYAVVKADGYGHGDIQIAKQAIQAGADRLAVAILDEAIRLREAGIDVPILVMGWIRPEHASLAASYDITVTCYQKEWVEQVKQQSLPSPLKVHVKLDTGMGRIGVRDEQELLRLAQSLKAQKMIEVEGIFTHFATADEETTSHFENQLAKFEALWQAFQQYWEHPVIVHIGNSAASMRYPDKMIDYVRFGISMYGLYPSAVTKTEHPIDVKPAMTLHSRLIHVKQVEKGSTISYGATYQAETNEWIGTVPLGYADGICRALQGADVLINGERCEIVGRICMDQFMVRLSHPAKVGDQVTLIGKQQNEMIEMDEWADKLDTINYEVACMISSRVPRIYVNG
ncbi:alanine racemase [Gracilibacillus halophilus YIM-C55.5]|uniref:Alanine racemase n=1 Tax=Gracilibacillus halophilus YIM-C55.5 TaxID=1308866 RepID=N4WPI5_9BACI|nr:alanine racemase [Gracilibacillus halophilus]ENH96390.1 alanine racemase [Gracilibacillus halophilus YIM-C55.5]